MFTIVQFLRARANRHTVHEGRIKRVYCSTWKQFNGLDNSYQPISHFVYMQYRSTHPSGFVHGICASILHIYKPRDVVVNPAIGTI